MQGLCWRILLSSVPEKEEDRRTSKQSCGALEHRGVPHGFDQEAQDWPGNEHCPIIDGRIDRYRCPAFHDACTPIHEPEQDREGIAMTDTAEESCGPDLCFPKTRNINTSKPWLLCSPSERHGLCEVRDGTHRERLGIEGFHHHQCPALSLQDEERAIAGPAVNATATSR